MAEFAEGAVGFAGELVEAVFFRVKNEVVSSGIIDFVAGEGLFESGETSPRMRFWRVFRGDTPKIENFEVFFVGV